MDSLTTYPGIRFAQMATIYSSTILTGFLASFSYTCVPTLAIAPPELQLRQYQTMGAIGFSTAPKLVLFTAVGWGGLAWAAYKTGETSEASLYSLAAVGTPMIILYTVLVIAPTNAELNKMAAVAAKDVGSEVDGAEVKALMQKWKRLNYVRTVVAFVASGIGVVATLGWRL